MEAIALWDFDASQTDEMNLKKGTKLCCQTKSKFGPSKIEEVEVCHSDDFKVVNMVINTEDGGWYKAVNGLHSGFIPASYIRLEPHDWYREPMSRSEAERFLLQKDSVNSYTNPDGAFIIRKSESDKNGFALSVKHEDTVQHFKILTDSNNKFYIWPNSVFLSINQLVEKYHTENVSGDPKKVIHLRDTRQEKYEALYDFSPANAEEVALKKGDIISLIAKSDPNWWEGEVQGKKGFFPKNYVREVK